jgi:hypothetical protein
MLEGTKVIMLLLGLPNHLWAELMSTITKIHNIVPTSRLNEGTPRDTFTQHKESWPQVKDLWHISCKALTFIEDKDTRKLNLKA